MRAPSSARKPATSDPTLPKPSTATVAFERSKPAWAAHSRVAAKTVVAVGRPPSLFVSTCGGAPQLLRMTFTSSSVVPRSVPMKYTWRSTSGRIARAKATSTSSRRSASSASGSAMPAFAPPVGKFRKLHFRVMERAFAATSSTVRSGASRMPPPAGEPGIVRSSTTQPSGPSSSSVTWHTSCGRSSSSVTAGALTGGAARPRGSALRAGRGL